MAKAENTKRKKPAASKAVSSSKKTKIPRPDVRVRRATKKQTRTKTKTDVKKRAQLPNGFKLATGSFVFIKKFWKPLFGIVLIYAILNLIFVNGFLGGIGSSVSNIKNDINSKNSSKLSSAVSGFGGLAVSGGNSSGQGVTMQTVLLVIESLVIIWALRHLFSGEKIGVKQAYYQSGTPLIPFLLVTFVIMLQLLPIAVGSAVLVVVLSTVSGAPAAVIFSVLFVLLALWSLRMVSSSIFALYIVTLPDMQPRAALRWAKNLAAYRRLQLFRKILFMVLVVFIIMGIIIVPLILVASFLVPAVFFILSMLAILYAHTYLYSLYKGLLE